MANSHQKKRFKHNETKQQVATNKCQFYDLPTTNSDPQFLSSTSNTASGSSTSLPNDLHNSATANPGSYPSVAFANDFYYSAAGNTTSAPSTSYQNDSYNLFMPNETLSSTCDLFPIFDDDVI
jgi:hypothetical protein